jgi:hypothetical protein
MPLLWTAPANQGPADLYEANGFSTGNVVSAALIGVHQAEQTGSNQT